MFLRKFSGKFVLPVMVGALSLFLTTACSKRAGQQQAVLPMVTVTPAIEKIIPFSVPIVGQVIAKRHVQLKARITGFLTKQNFIEGSYVKSGQILYEIQQEQYIAQRDQAQAALLKAQAFYDNAIIEYTRQKNLWKTNATSKKEFDNATQNKYASEGSLLNAKALLALAKLDLSYTQIYAPFDGRIGASTYYPGNLVDISSNPLAELVMVDPIWVEFEPREEILVNILQDKNSNTHIPDNVDTNFSTKGITIKLILSNGTLYPDTGVIDFVNNKTDPQTGTIQMRATFKNPKQLLIPGNYVTLLIEKNTTIPSLIIPQASIQNDQIGPYIFVVNKKNLVEQRYVTIGQVYGSYIVIKSGLTKEELVVTDGILRVKQSDIVSYKVAAQDIAIPQKLQSLNQI